MHGPAIPAAPRVYTARLALTEPGVLLANAAVRVRNGSIEAVGKRSDFSDRLDCPEIALGNVVLTPGLINAHTHLEYTCAAGKLEATAFLKWLPRMIELKKNLGQKEIHGGVSRGLKELARRGTTGVADISTYGVGPSLLQGSGLRYRVFHEVIAVKPPWVPIIEEMEKRIEMFSPGTRGSQGIAPHAPYTVARGLLEKLRQHFQANGRNFPFSIHVAESREEVTCLTQSSGGLRSMLTASGFLSDTDSPAALASSPLHFLEAGRHPGQPPDVLIHGNYLTSHEMHRLAEKKAAVLVVCPGTREFHRVQTPVRSRANEAGLPLALGTDSLASNHTLSLWHEMRHAVRGQDRWTVREAWTAATLGGARALGQPDLLGRIRPGFHADFIALPAPVALPRHADDLLDAWLLGPAEPSVLGAWVQGRLIHRNDTLLAPETR